MTCIINTQKKIVQVVHRFCVNKTEESFASEVAPSLTHVEEAEASHASVHGIGAEGREGRQWRIEVEVGPHANGPVHRPRLVPPPANSVAATNSDDGTVATFAAAAAAID